MLKKATRGYRSRVTHPLYRQNPIINHEIKRFKKPSRSQSWKCSAWEFSSCSSHPSPLVSRSSAGRPGRAQVGHTKKKQGKAEIENFDRTIIGWRYLWSRWSRSGPVYTIKVLNYTLMKEDFDQHIRGSRILSSKYNKNECFWHQDRQRCCRRPLPPASGAQR